MRVGAAIWRSLFVSAPAQAHIANSHVIVRTRYLSRIFLVSKAIGGQNCAITSRKKKRMRPNHAVQIVSLWCVALIVGLLPLSAFATSGTWTGLAGDGLWFNPANWTPAIADGAGDTADFSTVDIQSDTVIQLGQPRLL